MKTNGFLRIANLNQQLVQLDKNARYKRIINNQKNLNVRIVKENYLTILIQMQIAMTVKIVMFHVVNIALKDVPFMSKITLLDLKVLINIHVASAMKCRSDYLYYCCLCILLNYYSYFVLKLFLNFFFPRRVHLWLSYNIVNMYNPQKRGMNKWIIRIL